MGYISKARYTDAEAVAAADASDKFVERNVENIVTSSTDIRKQSSGMLFKLINELTELFPTTALMQGRIQNTSYTYNGMSGMIDFPSVLFEGTDAAKEIGKFMFYKPPSQNYSEIWVLLNDSTPTLQTVMVIKHDKIDVKNLPIKDIKNHADATLSGTPKLIELLIGTTQYYFKVYPTKT